MVTILGNIFALIGVIMSTFAMFNPLHWKSETTSNISSYGLGMSVGGFILIYTATLFY